MKRLLFQISPLRRRQLQINHTFRTISATTYFHQKHLVKKIDNKITIRNYDESNQTPLVLLFGWGNGKLKHLEKYSSLFESKNFTTVCITTSLINSLLRTSTAGLQEAQNVRKVLDDLLVDNPNRPVILYPFSNAGCAIYHLLTQTMLSDTLSPRDNVPGNNFKGIIFDSCPVVPNEESAVIVRNAFVQNQNIFVASLLGPIIEQAVKQIALKDKQVQSFMQEMESFPIKVPQLFLFSKADQLAPSKDILEFIRKREKFGVNIDYKLWSDSPHVGHLRYYEDEYKQMINNFIEKSIHQ